MASKVTQCPKCQTSFRVTDAQLKIANGAVRCGSCLHIFDAPDHWLNTPSAVKAPEPPTVPKIEPRPEPTPAPALSPQPISKAEPKAEPEPESELELELELEPDETGDGDMLFSDDFGLGDELENIDSPPPKPAFNDTIEHSALNNIFDADDLVVADVDDDLFINEEPQEPIEDDDVLVEDTGPQPAFKHSEDLIGAEDLDFEGIDRETEHNDAPSKSNGEAGIGDSGLGIRELGAETAHDTREVSANTNRENSGAFSETFLDLDTWEEDPTAIFNDLDTANEESDTDEERWAKKLLEEAEVEEPAEKDEGPEPFEEFPDIFDSIDEEPALKLDPALLDILDEPESSIELSPPSEDEFILGDEPLLTGERIGYDKRELLANIEPEPVEITREAERSRWIQRSWAAAIVVASAALLVQYFAFNFDTIARDKDYRPLMATLCSTAGCKLPSLHDVRLIRSSNLLVRSHPRANQALVVDAIITNRANFIQPFPIMELQFTDLAGTVIAGRRFTPTEYLSGELTGSEDMPTQQPIHISLEIVDPGQQAVNYQLRLHPMRES